MDYFISFIGLALVGAPWILRYTSNTGALVASLVLGAVICGVAGYRAFSKDPRKWEEWIVLVAGVAAVAVPFIFGFAAPAFWSFVVLGVIASALAAYQGFSDQPHLPTPGRL